MMITLPSSNKKSKNHIKPAKIKHVLKDVVKIFGLKKKGLQYQYDKNICKIFAKLLCQINFQNFASHAY